MKQKFILFVNEFSCLELTHIDTLLLEVINCYYKYATSLSEILQKNAIFM